MDIVRKPATKVESGDTLIITDQFGRSSLLQVERAWDEGDSRYFYTHSIATVHVYPLSSTEEVMTVYRPVQTTTVQRDTVTPSEDSKEPEIVVGSSKPAGEQQDGSA